MVGGGIAPQVGGKALGVPRAVQMAVAVGLDRLSPNFTPFSLTMLPLLGYHIGFDLHVDMVCGCFLLALAIVLIAAWIPSRRATRLDLLQPLKHE